MQSNDSNSIHSCASQAYSTCCWTKLQGSRSTLRHTTSTTAPWRWAHQSQILHSCCCVLWGCHEWQSRLAETHWPPWCGSKQRGQPQRHLAVGDSPPSAVHTCLSCSPQFSSPRSPHSFLHVQVFRGLPGLSAAVSALSPPLAEWRRFIYCESMVAGQLLGKVDHFPGTSNRGS